MAIEQIGNLPSIKGIHHFLQRSLLYPVLQLIKEHPHELLYILLNQYIYRLPEWLIRKAKSKRNVVHPGGMLQVPEYLLELMQDIIIQELILILH